MNKELKNKLKLVIYGFIALLGAFLIYISFNTEEPNPSALLLNLGAGLAEVFIIFALIQVFGLESDDEQANQLDELQKLLFDQKDMQEHQSHAIDDILGRIVAERSLNNEMDSIDDLEQRLSELTQLDAIGFGLNNFLENYSEELTQRIVAGAKVRIVLVHPDSLAANIIRHANSNYDEKLKESVQILKETNDVLNAMPDAKGSFEIRLTNTFPTSCVMFIDPQKKLGRLRIVLYNLTGEAQVGGGRLCLNLDSYQDKKYFKRYRHQFHKIWRVAEPLNYDDPRYQ